MGKVNRPLRALHVIPSLASSHGGPTVALPLMARALIQAGVSVTIAATDDDGPGVHRAVPLDRPVEGAEGATYHYFRKQTDFYRFSWPLTRWLARNVAGFDIVHIHSLFSYPSTSAAWLARWRRVPYVIRPLGVLNRWGMVHRRQQLKRWSVRYLEGPILRGAATMHYTSRQEQEQATAAGAKPGVIIPLGIDTAVIKGGLGPAAFYARFPVAARRSVVLFLSRLDAKKGIDLLLPAFAEARRHAPESLLVLAGDGDPAHVATLRTQAARLGLGESEVLWTGFLGGEDKAAAFAAASVFVLPSYSENFGIAAAEAMAAGVPSVLSDQVAVAVEAEAAGAALVVPCQVPPLAAALVRLLTEACTRADLSAKASQLAADKYSLEAAGQALAQLYQDIRQQS